MTYNMHEHETGALKHKSGKSRMDLVPPEAVEALADILTYGAEKYDDHNWERGIPYMDSYASVMRHLMAWRKGVDTDTESGFLHIEHALTNLAMIVTQERRKRDDLDNRPSSKETECHSCPGCMTDEEYLKHIEESAAQWARSYISDEDYLRGLDAYDDDDDR